MGTAHCALLDCNSEERSSPCMELWVKYQLFLSDFNKTWISSANFREILKFHETPSSGSFVFPCGRTDWQIEGDEEADSRIFSSGYFPGVKLYLADYNLTPGKYPEENIQYSNHGESLKSRKLIVAFCDVSSAPKIQELLRLKCIGSTVAVRLVRTGKINVCEIYSKVRPRPLIRGGRVSLITLLSINAFRWHSVTTVK